MSQSAFDMTDAEWERRYDAMLHTAANKGKTVIYRDADGWVMWQNGSEVRLEKSPFFWVDPVAWRGITGDPNTPDTWAGALRIPAG